MVLAQVPLARADDDDREGGLLELGRPWGVHSPQSIIGGYRTPHGSLIKAKGRERIGVSHQGR